MIKVAALTTGKHDPASRFRVRQFIKPLAQLGVQVSEHYPIVNKYRFKRQPPLALLMRVPGLAGFARERDITWFGREMVSGKFTLERFAGTKRVFDVDDAIWLYNDSSFSERIANLCDGVIAGNRFLAEHYERQGARRSWIVPTSIDTELWTPAAKEREPAAAAGQSVGAAFGQI
ncbi:MAG: hypothetical protein WKF84_21645 [Pyrinomonadaceae bacterium]